MSKQSVFVRKKASELLLCKACEVDSTQRRPQGDYYVTRLKGLKIPSPKGRMGIQVQEHQLFEYYNEFHMCNEEVLIL